MDKKIIIPIVVVTIAIIVSILIIESFPINQPKIQVSYVIIRFTSPGWRLYFGINNTYNSQITTIEYSLDELVSEISNPDSFRVRPGQHLDSYFFLGGNDLDLSFSNSYNVTLTFTFEDGKHVSYSKFVTPEKR